MKIDQVLVIHSTCRCGGKTIFEDDFQRLTDPTYAILKIVKNIDNYTNHPFKTHQYDTIFIGWKRPRERCVKLNYDEAYNDSLGLAGYGGLFRNSNGRWLKRYSRKSERCDVFFAEIWEYILGNATCFEIGFTLLSS